MSARNRKLRMEQMEDRRLMAVTGTAGPVGNLPASQNLGDIAAYVQSGNLYVNEASPYLNSNNGVAITQLSPGHIRVMGTAASANGLASVVNGQAFQDFAVTGNLYVNLGGGNDSVQIGDFGANGNNAPSFNELHIDTSAPTPVISKAVSSPVTNAIPDNDYVMVWGAHTLGDLTITTGAGDDNINVQNSVIGDGPTAHDLVINSGAGSDLVNVSSAIIRRNVDIQTYSSATENDNDSVGFNVGNINPVQVGGSVNVRTGGGNDHISVTDPSVADSLIHSVGMVSQGSMTFDTGAGNDVAFLRNLWSYSDVSINMGAGADTLTMQEYGTGLSMPVSGQLNVQMYSSLTESDVDTVTISNMHSGGSLSLLTGGGNDVIQLADISSNMDINLDAGRGMTLLR